MDVVVVQAKIADAVFNQTATPETSRVNLVQIS
jgi:hypothetical protein